MCLLLDSRCTHSLRALKQHVGSLGESSGAEQRAILPFMRDGLWAAMVMQNWSLVHPACKVNSQ